MTQTSASILLPHAAQEQVLRVAWTTMHTSCGLNHLGCIGHPQNGLWHHISEYIRLLVLLGTIQGVRLSTCWVASSATTPCCSSSCWLTSGPPRPKPCTPTVMRRGSKAAMPPLPVPHKHSHNAHYHVCTLLLICAGKSDTTVLRTPATFWRAEQDGDDMFCQKKK